MIYSTDNPDFIALLPANDAIELLNRLLAIQDINGEAFSNLLTHYSKPIIKAQLDCWSTTNSQQLSMTTFTNDDKEATNGLIKIFNTLFAKQNVKLVRGKHEPEYFAAHNDQPARIKFANGFFASALHEVSHWCIAGEQRRQLNDFGYWYAPDGRTAAQQQAFERVEIKPQALECLFTLACQRPFQVSQDNLFADFDTSHSSFAKDVYQQTIHFIKKPETLPRDAKTLLSALLINFIC